MDYRQMKSVVEGLLLVSGDEGLDGKQIAQVLEQDVPFVLDLIRDMQSEYQRRHRGMQIIELAGSFQLATLAEHAPYFEKLARSPARATLSQAALETLAIVAYKQPITRVEIEEIRGVSSDRAIHTLAARDLIKETGRAEAVGRPILYGTTKLFLDYFGLGSLQELPDYSSYDSDEHLQQETRMLFERLDGQVTIDDLKKEV